MTTLNTYCASFGLSALQTDICQQYLETPTSGQADDNLALDVPFIEFSDLYELTKYVKDNIDEIAKDRENIADIKRIAACALSSAINSKDFNGKYY